ncbi:MAG: hypothetical protein AAGC92_05560 [Pseudomonadota bacterium]
MTRETPARPTQTETDPTTVFVPDTDMFDFDFETPREQSSDVFGFGHLMEVEEEDELQTRPADSTALYVDPKDPLGPLADWGDDAPIDPWG